MAICINPIYLKKYNVSVPCGKCGNCIKRYISDWTIRLKHELLNSQRSYFLTLTYEKDPLQLYKKDLQDYFKRLRKVGFKFSYFALGDYGDTYGRPHYHAILFVKGYFVPEYLPSLWISGSQVRKRGFIDCKPLSIGRISYVVRYGYLAKLDWDKKDKRQKPFFLMSKRPALGLSYITPKVKRYHRQHDVWYYREGPYIKPLPRYFRDKLFYLTLRELHKEKVVEIRDKRMSDELAYISQTSDQPLKTYYERLEYQSNVYLEGLRKQKRLKNKNL